MMESGTEPRTDGSTGRFRLDPRLNELLTKPVTPLSASLLLFRGQAKLPDAVFPQHPELLCRGSVESVIQQPHIPPARRHWTKPLIYRALRGWLFPYIESRLLPGEFQPIICYLFTEYKCNLDCHYCWAFDNHVKIAGDGTLIPTSRDLDTSARNFTGNAEVDRELWRGASARVSYIYSQTQDLYVVTSWLGNPGAASLLGLARNGGSHYHEFEATLRYRPSERGERNQRFRFGVYSLNLTNHTNPLDVYNDVNSPYFGHFVGFQQRREGLDIDLVK